VLIQVSGIEGAANGLLVCRLFLVITVVLKNFVACSTVMPWQCSGSPRKAAEAQQRFVRLRQRYFAALSASPGAPREACSVRNRRRESSASA